MFTKASLTFGSVLIAIGMMGAGCSMLSPTSTSIKETSGATSTSTSSDEGRVCPEIYQPVCGEQVVYCIKAPCPPLKHTFSNRCKAEEAGAQNIIDGACKDEQIPNVTGEVKVTSPLADAKITSPVVVKGEAPGTWFFEGSFPVEVTDMAGKVVGQGVAQAKSDWKTEKNVPFEASIKFTPGGAKEGYIVLRNDNPSGEIKNAQSLKIPVKF